MTKGNWLEKLRSAKSNFEVVFSEFITFVENNTEWKAVLKNRLFQLFRRYHYTSNQVDLINSLAWMNLADFPNNLPKEIKDKLEELKLEEERRKKKQEEHTIFYEWKIPEIDTDENILELMGEHLGLDPKNTKEGDFNMSVGIIYPLVYPNPENPEPFIPIRSTEYLLKVQKFIENNPHSEVTKIFEFDRVICTNKLVTKLLYLESYVKDIYKLMFFAKPSILREAAENTLKLADLTLLNNWYELLELIFNEYLFEKRFSLLELLNYLKNLKNVHLALSKEEFNHLRLCVLVRNVYIHNGGIIDKEFLRKHRKPKKINTIPPKIYPEYIEGRPCPISFGLINLLDEISYRLTSYLCLRVLIDYLNYPLKSNWEKF